VEWVSFGGQVGEGELDYDLVSIFDGVEGGNGERDVEEGRQNWAGIAAAG
jgi:hypothetical protein